MKKTLKVMGQIGIITTAAVAAIIAGRVVSEVVFEAVADGLMPESWKNDNEIKEIEAAG